MSDTALLATYIGLLPRDRAATPVQRSEEDLATLYARLPEGTSRLPHLYERLLLSFSWKEAEPFAHDMVCSHPDYDRPLGYSLLGNPTGKAPFGPLLRFMQRDSALWTALSSAQLIPFAQGGRQGYDPICFDLKQTRNADCPIVGIDHEEILCNNRIRMAIKLAPSFHDLVEDAVKHK